MGRHTARGVIELRIQWAKAPGASPTISAFLPRLRLCSKNSERLRKRGIRKDKVLQDATESFPNHFLSERSTTGEAFRTRASLFPFAPRSSRASPGDLSFGRYA